MRYRIAGGGLSVEGTIRGTAFDILSIIQYPNPAHVAIAGNEADAPGSLTGTIVVTALRPGLLGSIEGAVNYIDDQGGMTACSSADIMMISANR